MSHLADADSSQTETVNNAVELFDSCVDTILATGASPTFFHIGQTAGSLRVHSRYANAVRPGIGVYGINPFSKDHPLYEILRTALQPALSLTSTITAIINLEKAERVGYNYTFEAPKQMRIGILPIGYYEGFDSALSNTGVVKVGSTFAPVTGRICMNTAMISLENTKAVIGDAVVIYSNNQDDANAIDTIANTYHLFNYELLIHLNQDVRRVLVE